MITALQLAAELALWSAILLLAYIYALYPLILFVASSLTPQRVRRGSSCPPVSLVISAFDEEDVIARTLESVLASDYPEESLQVLVADDGSSDATASIVEPFTDRGVTLLRLSRRGKVAALDAAIQHAKGEVLVFIDANTILEPDALRCLVRGFADPAVGGVAGNTGYRIPAEADSSGKGERLYWRYDRWLKRLESRVASVVSAHGGLYAIRAALYRRPPDGAATDDFMISTAVVEQGYRLVFEPEARAWEGTAPGAGDEFRRRVRLMTRGWHAIRLRRRLLNPFRHGWYALILLSHKVLRRLTPLALLVAFLATVTLMPQGEPYRTLAAVQVTVLALALLGALVRRRRVGHARLLYVPFFFVASNLAALIAFANALRGRRIASWTPQRKRASG